MKHEESKLQENCRVDCISFALDSLRPDARASFDLTGIKSALGTVDFFKKLGFEVKFLLPPLAFMMPFSWALLIRHRQNVCFGKPSLVKFADGFQKAAYIYHLTPHQLYGYAANWTHCVCEMFIKGQRNFFDGIDPEYGRPARGGEWPPSHQTLMSYWGVVICVGDKPRDTI